MSTGHDERASERERIPDEHETDDATANLDMLREFARVGAL